MVLYLFQIEGEEGDECPVKRYFTWDVVAPDLETALQYLKQEAPTVAVVTAQRVKRVTLVS